METDAAKSQTHNAAGATQSMMAEAAEHDASQDPNSEFYNTGRVGRRNALPDILNHHHVTTSTADLPEKLSALSTKDADSGGGSSSEGASSTSTAETSSPAAQQASATTG